MAYLGGAVGVGVDFPPLLGAFRGVRGDVPPAGEVMKFAGGLLGSTSKEAQGPFLSEPPVELIVEVGLRSVRTEFL